ncbi:activator of basal transcription 1 [Platysternon megacephalum]|uniref:Activator of basal transcription 1 n=1 Tax=Platysternon megacephalum TaxID=55544 RepID=A0A4D9DKW4_9SAUR|nr:activator of basal transcription 1 [Platysternon megacephalum]
MERLSAEGHFFHRECFKCDVCSTTLRLAIYAFDVEEGKFYCKPHFTHCKTSNKHRKRRSTLKTQEKVCIGYTSNAINVEAVLWGLVALPSPHTHAHTPEKRGKVS